MKLLEFFRKRGCEPLMFKRVTKHPQEVVTMYANPDLIDRIYNVREGDVFDIDQSTLTVIETPGHTSDSICLLLEEEWQDTILFTGDHIVGSNSVCPISSLPLGILRRLRCLHEEPL